MYMIDGYKWIYVQIVADWYTNDINEELGFEKNSWQPIKCILEALPLEKSYWNKLIKTPWFLCPN